MKLELSIPTRDFVYLCMILILAFICIFVYKEENTIFVVNTYKNCTCPDGLSSYYHELVNSYQPIENQLWNTNVEEGEELITNESFTLCPEGLVAKQVTCDCYEEFGCMLYCYECVNESEVDERFLTVGLFGENGTKKY